MEFVRFGGEDVVRHRLVQRIVEAYDEHAEPAAPRAAARRTSRAAVLEVEVLGRSVPALRPRPRSSASSAIALASAEVEDGHVAVAFVDADTIAELNAEHRGKNGPDGRAVVPRRRGRRRRPARASWATS